MPRGWEGLPDRINRSVPRRNGKTARLRGLRLALQDWAIDLLGQESSLRNTARIGCATRLTAWLAGAQQCCAPTWRRLVLRRYGRTCRGLRRLVAWRTSRYRGCGWGWR